MPASAERNCRIMPPLDTDSRYQKELKAWRRQQEWFWWGLMLGVVAAVVYRIRVYLLKDTRKRNRHGSIAGSMDGGFITTT